MLSLLTILVPLFGACALAFLVGGAVVGARRARRFGGILAVVCTAVAFSSGVMDLPGERITVFIASPSLAGNPELLQCSIEDCGSLGPIGVVVASSSGGDRSDAEIVWVDPGDGPAGFDLDKASGDGVAAWSLATPSGAQWEDRLAVLANSIERQRSWVDSACDWILQRQKTVVLLWDSSSTWSQLSRGQVTEAILDRWASGRVELHLRDVRSDQEKLRLEAEVATEKLPTRRSRSREPLRLLLRGPAGSDDYIVASKVTFRWNNGGDERGGGTSEGSFWSEKFTFEDQEFEFDSNSQVWVLPVDLVRLHELWSPGFHRLDVDVELASGATLRTATYVHIVDRTLRVIGGKNGSRLSSSWSHRVVPGGDWFPDGELRDQVTSAGETLFTIPRGISSNPQLEDLGLAADLALASPLAPPCGSLDWSQSWDDPMPRNVVLLEPTRSDLAAFEAAVGGSAADWLAAGSNLVVVGPPKDDDGRFDWLPASSRVWPRTDEPIVVNRQRRLFLLNDQSPLARQAYGGDLLESGQRDIVRFTAFQSAVLERVFEGSQPTVEFPMTDDHWFRMTTGSDPVPGLSVRLEGKEWSVQQAIVSKEILEADPVERERKGGSFAINVRALDPLEVRGVEGIHERTLYPNSVACAFIYAGPQPSGDALPIPSALVARGISTAIFGFNGAHKGDSVSGSGLDWASWLSRRSQPVAAEVLPGRFREETVRKVDLAIDAQAVAESANTIKGLLAASVAAAREERVEVGPRGRILDVRTARGVRSAPPPAIHRLLDVRPTARSSSREWPVEVHAWLTTDGTGSPARRDVPLIVSSVIGDGHVTCLAYSPFAKYPFCADLDFTAIHPHPQSAILLTTDGRRLRLGLGLQILRDLDVLQAAPPPAGAGIPVIESVSCGASGNDLVLGVRLPRHGAGFRWGTPHLALGEQSWPLSVLGYDSGSGVLRLAPLFDLVGSSLDQEEQLVGVARVELGGDGSQGTAGGEVFVRLGDAGSDDARWDLTAVELARLTGGSATESSRESVDQDAPLARVIDLAVFAQLLLSIAVLLAFTPLVRPWSGWRVFRRKEGWGASLDDLEECVLEAIDASGRIDRQRHARPQAGVPAGIRTLEAGDSLGNVITRTLVGWTPVGRAIGLSPSAPVVRVRERVENFSAELVVECHGGLVVPHWSTPRTKIDGVAVLITAIHALLSQRGGDVHCVSDAGAAFEVAGGGRDVLESLRPALVRECAQRGRGESDYGERAWSAYLCDATSDSDVAFEAWVSACVQRGIPPRLIIVEDAEDRVPVGISWRRGAIALEDRSLLPDESAREIIEGRATRRADRVESAGGHFCIVRVADPVRNWSAALSETGVLGEAGA